MTKLDRGLSHHSLDIIEAIVSRYSNPEFIPKTGSNPRSLSVSGHASSCTSSKDPFNVSRCKNKTASWWSKFHKYSAEDLKLCRMSKQLVACTPGSILGHDTLLHRKATVISSRGNDTIAAVIVRLHATHSSLVEGSVLYMIYCTFIVIASSCTDPTEWAEYSHKHHGLRKLSRHQVHGLFGTLGESLPAGMTEEDFDEQLHEWRNHGSCYAFIARHVGLGALMHLAGHGLAPASMRGCTKGNEKADPNDTQVPKRKPSERAFAHLLGVVGIADLAASSGANRLMHGLLWELCSWFAGFRSRENTSTPFPGFERYSDGL